MGNQVKRMSSLTDVAQACEPVVNQMTVVKSEGLIHMVMCTLYTIGHLGLSFFYWVTIKLRGYSNISNII